MTYELRYSFSFDQPIILAIEPNADKKIWHEICELASNIINSLPGRVQEICLLGSRETHTVTTGHALRDFLPGIYQSTQGMVSCINPLLEDLQRQGYNGLVVILASKPPVDWLDWNFLPWSDRFLLITVCECTDQIKFKQVDARFGLDRVLSSLENPPTRIELGRNNFAPLWYQSPCKNQVQIDFHTTGHFGLTVDPKAYQVDLKIHLMDISPPVLQVTRKNGDTEKWHPIQEKIYPETPQWQPVPIDLQSVVLAGITQQPFTCPQCGNLHSHDCRVCPQADLILNGLPLDTCLLFSEDGKRYLNLTSVYAYPLNEGDNLLTQDGKLYSAQPNGWKFVTTIDDYQQVDNNGSFALFHTT